MSEAAEPTKVDMSPATITALVRRGGNLYISTNSAGWLVARTDLPADAILYDTIHGDGWALHIDREIAPPLRWVVKWKRLLWPHFEALYDPPEESGWSRPTLGGLIDAFFNDLP